MSQGKLLRDRRFWPMFWTQFFGAFNDNLFKNALVILIAYRGIDLWGLGSERLVALAAGLFILPFLLFSASAGQISDKLAKSRLVRLAKAAEFVIMGVAALGFYLESVPLLLAVLFLMGAQSAFFGPVKYSILPELLDEDELVGGNALVETGTFLSILLGTIVGGVLVGLAGVGQVMIGLTVVVVAALGWTASAFIRPTLPGNPDLVFSLNPFRPTFETYLATRRNRPVYLSILGISWFWFLGASFLTLLPNYCREVVGGNEHVVTLFLALFCVGIAAGSLLCERLSRERLELGLVPLGSIGMSFFAFRLYLAGPGPILEADGLLGPSAVLGSLPGLAIGVDLALVALFSGFFTVPLYTMIQQRSLPSERSRVIAGNNILNALFMVASSVMLMGLLSLELTIPQIFLVMAFLNAAVAVYIYTVIPEFLLRFVIWIIACIMYRVRVTGRENIPMEGPAVLISNHVSFVDWMIIASACKRPARFVMHHTYFKMPVVRILFRDAKVIPIAPAREDRDTLAQAFDLIAQALEEGELVCIFPEGKLTKTGLMNPFRPGIEKILARTPVPVVPMALNGMWGSFFSKKDGQALKKPFRRVRSRVSLKVGAPLSPEGLTKSFLAETVAKLGGWEPPHPLEPGSSAESSERG